MHWQSGHKTACVPRANNVNGKAKESADDADAKRMNHQSSADAAADEAAKTSQPETLDEVLNDAAAAEEVEAPLHEEPSALDRLVEMAAEKSRQGDYEGSYAAYSEAIALQPMPADAKLYEARSQAALLTGRMEVALKDAEQALALDPKSLRARIRLLRVLLRHGELARCLQVGQGILDADATNQAARTDVSSANLNKRRLEAARAAAVRLSERTAQRS